MRFAAPLVLLGVLLLAIARADRPAPRADLVFVNQNEVFTLDPQRMSYIQDLRLADALYEGLLRWDNRTFEILPAAAELPEISSDGRRLTFRIRPEARWSNGAPLQAADFVFAWRRAMLPDTAADYSGLFFTIRGARAFFRHRAELLAGFAADPWAGDPAPATLRTCGARLERLLDADDAPPELAPPASLAAAGLRAQVARLRAVPDDADPAALAVERAEATAAAAYAAHLAAPERRAAEAAWTWRRTLAHFERTVGLRAADERTLEVELERPCPYFLDLVCFGVFAPVHRPTVEGWPEPAAPATAWRDADAPPPSACRFVSLSPDSGRLEQKHDWCRPGAHVGNGPYRIVRWRYKRDLRLERNELFHGADAVPLRTIEAISIPDANTAVLAFGSGAVDWLVDVSTDYEADMLAQRAAYERHHAEAIAEGRAAGRSPDEILAALPPPERGERRDIHAIPLYAADFFSFNCRPTLADGRPNPFHDARVRRAFVRATDRHAIVEHATRLGEPVLTALIPPGSIPGYPAVAGLVRDPAAARAALADAGWSDRDGDGRVEDADGKPFPVVDLLYTTNVPRWKWMSLALKTQWQDALGVSVELRPTDTKFYKEDLKRGDFMIARGRWYGDYGDPSTFLELFRTTDGNNDRGFASPAIDALLDEADAIVDREARLAKYAECERILFNEALPMLVVCQPVQVMMYEPGVVTGISRHPRAIQHLAQLDRRDRHERSLVEARP